MSLADPRRELWTSKEEWADAFLSAVRGRAADPRLERLDGEGYIWGALQGEDVARGGALVPEEVADEIARPPLSSFAIENLCRAVEMGSLTKTVPFAYDEDHDATSAPYGMSVRWPEVGTDRSGPQNRSLARRPEAHGAPGRSVDRY